MKNINELIAQPVIYYCAPEDDSETQEGNGENIDDEDWNDSGPSDDIVEKSLPSEEIQIPEDDE